MNVRIALASPAFLERAPSGYQEETVMCCQKTDHRLVGSVRTLVEACLDWNRVPVRAKDLNVELEERASIDIVQVRERTNRTRESRVISMGGYPNGPFCSASFFYNAAVGRADYDPAWQGWHEIKYQR